MKKKLIDEEDFKDKIDELTGDIDEIKVLLESLSTLAQDLKAEPTEDNHSHMKAEKEALDNKAKSAARVLQELKESAQGDETRTRTVERVETQAKKALQDYEAKKPDFELALKMNSPSRFSEGEKSRKPTAGGQADEVPVMQVYNQSEFVEKRQKDIERLNKDAREINSIARDVNGKIYAQDEKLDKMNHQLENHVITNLHTANEDLAKAEEISKKRRTNYTFFVAIIAVGVLIIILTVYFLFK